jgi:hypothetical protein
MLHNLIPTEGNRCTKSSDLGLWDILTQDEISFWIQKGPSECQDCDRSFDKLKQSFKNKIRYCSKGLFHSKEANGVKYNHK